MRHNNDPIGKELEEAFNYIEYACFHEDLFSDPRGDVYEDALKKFIRLLVYCGDHHFYAIRDRALKKILRDL